MIAAVRHMIHEKSHRGMYFSGMKKPQEQETVTSNYIDRRKKQTGKTTTLQASPVRQKKTHYAHLLNGKKGKKQAKEIRNE